MTPLAEVTPGTTAVIPRPTYPPLPTAPVPRLPNRTPPPGPDIIRMIPQAVAQVQELNKVEDISARDTAGLSGGGDFGAPWNLPELFQRQPATLPDRHAYPVADAFTLYLMSVLCRYGYYESGILPGGIEGAILAALGPDWTHRVITNPLAPEMRYDLWRGNAGQIIAIQGTTTLTEWLRNLLPTFVPIPGVVPVARAYSGIMATAAKFTGFINTNADGAGLEGRPTILTGHSLGGAVAQIMSGVINGAYKTAYPTETAGYPAMAQYTFGAPAWLSNQTTTFPAGWLDRHCRCYLPGDPVPFATQVGLRASRGVGLGVGLLAAINDTVDVETTKHASNKDVQLETVKAQTLAQYRSRIWRGLTNQAADLTAALVEQHSMSSYALACYYRAANAKESPAERMTQLVFADRLMDRADENAAK